MAPLSFVHQQLLIPFLLRVCLLTSTFLQKWQRKSNIAALESHFLPPEKSLFWPQVSHIQTRAHTHTFVTHLFLWFHTDTVRRHTFFPHTLTQRHMFPSVGVWMYSITGFYQPGEISPHSSLFLSLSLSHTHTFCVTLIYYCTLSLSYSLFSLPLFLSSVPEATYSPSFRFSLLFSSLFIHLSVFCPNPTTMFSFGFFFVLLFFFSFGLFSLG